MHVIYPGALDLLPARAVVVNILIKEMFVWIGTTVAAAEFGTARKVHLEALAAERQRWLFACPASVGSASTRHAAFQQAAKRSGCNTAARGSASSFKCRPARRGRSASRPTAPLAILRPMRQGS
jgi:hypothetical protein